MSVPGRGTVRAEIHFAPALVGGTLLRRYKRFLADVRLDSGETVTALCPNTGSLRSCSEPGRPVALSHHDSPARRHAFTWEMIRMGGGWVGVNTGLPNLLVERALKLGLIPELSGFSEVRREAPRGPGTRLDFRLAGPAGVGWVEVKSVSLLLDGDLQFPDAPTERGVRHLRELTRAAAEGDRACMLFLAQRPEGRVFRPADRIDPAYGEELRRAAAAGVEVLVYRADVGPERISWGDPVRQDLARLGARKDEPCSTR